MPGAYPNTPSPGPTAGPSTTHYDTKAYMAQPSREPTAQSPGPNVSKRLSSLRGFLPFKALRRSYAAKSPSSSPKVENERVRPSSSMSLRPTTPGTDSFDTDNTKPSLRHKVGAAFWNRKSSNPTSEAYGEAIQNPMNGNGFAHAGSPTSPRTNNLRNSVENQNGALQEANAHYRAEVCHNERSESPAPDRDTLDMSKNRKSGTVWRRASGQNLWNEERMPWTNSMRKASLDRVDRRRTEEEQTRSGADQSSEGVTNIDGEPTSASTMEVPIVLQRSYSPPPQLPLLVGGGGGMGDIFKDIQ